MYLENMNLKTHKYLTPAQHGKKCHKVAGKYTPNLEACEGCLLIEEQPIPELPGYKRRICRIDKFKMVEDTEENN